MDSEGLLPCSQHPVPILYRELQAARAVLAALLNQFKLCTFGKLNCYWSSPAQSYLTLGIVEIYDQDFCSLLDMYIFRSLASSTMRDGVGLSVGLRSLHRSTAKLLLISLAQWFLAPSPTGLMTILYYLTVLGAFRLTSLLLTVMLCKLCTGRGKTLCMHMHALPLPYSRPTTTSLL
jgi:hypothetical protein